MSKQSNVLPYSLEAEQSLLGSILIDNEVQFEIASKVKAEDFYVDSHKNIFRAIMDILADAKPVDLVTLIDVLSKTPSIKYDKKDGSNLELIASAEKKNMLEKVGGIEYLTELSKVTPSAANYEYYLEIVKRDSVLRKLIKCSDSISKDAKASDDGSKSLGNWQMSDYNDEAWQNASVRKEYGASPYNKLYERPIPLLKFSDIKEYENSEVYAKYKDKGLEIVGVSCDRKGNDWRKASEEEQLPWINLIDTQDANRVATKYAVHYIPTMYLIDQEGKMIGKMGHHELDAKLKELLGE